MSCDHNTTYYKPSAPNEVACALCELEIALGALADIAFASDLTMEGMRRKAKRIYKQLRASELRAQAS